MEWQFEQYDTDATWPTPHRDSLLLGVGTAVCCVEQNSGQLRWESTLEADIDAPPSIDKNAGFVVNRSGRVHAFDVSSGDLLWCQGVDGNDSVPTVADSGSVIVTTSEGLVSLDAETGEYEWESTLPSGPPGPPAVTEDIVYTGTEDGIVYAILRADGTIQWQTAVGAPLTRAGVVSKEETLYVPTAPVHSETSGAVHALDTTAKEVYWTAATSTATRADTYLVTPPVVHEGTVYVISGVMGRGENHLQAIHDGQVVWSTEVYGVGSSPPAITDEIALTYSGGSLLAFERTSGEKRWVATISSTRHYNKTMPHRAPVVTERSVVVRGPKKLFAVSTDAERQVDSTERSANSDARSVSSPNGTVSDRPPAESALVQCSRVSYPSTTSRIRGDATVRWGFHSAEGTLINPMLVDDTVYLADSRGIATALDTETGTARWLIELDGTLEKCPLVADGTLFLVGRDATFALDPRDGSVRSRDATLPDDPRQPTGRVATRADDVVSVGFTPDLESIVITVTTGEGVDDWRLEDEFPGYASVWDSYYGRIGTTLFVGLMFKPGLMEFYALDAKTESIKWRLVGNAGGGIDIFSPPILHEGSLFVVCSNTFYTVDLSE
jgi:outer membrane protein assembly factor BamB